MYAVNQEQPDFGKPPSTRETNGEKEKIQTPGEIQQASQALEPAVNTNTAGFKSKNHYTVLKKISGKSLFLFKLA